MAKLKIERLKEKYNLDAIDTELRSKYVNEGLSLRDLADFLNIRISKKFFEGMPFSGEHVYNVHNGNVSKETELELQRRMAEEGIEINELKSDWVGHMPVRSYLNRELGIDTSRQKKHHSPEEIHNNIRGLKRQQESIVQENLRLLSGFEGDNWDIHIEIRLIDRETAESIRLEEYLESQLPGDED